MKPILCVFGVSALLLGPIGLQIPSIGATEAFAGGGNGNGGGNGGGGGNGNGNGGGNGGGKGKGNGGGHTKSDAGKSAASTDVTLAPKPAKTKGANGALASELKGLNAAHASPNALANASPNSQVGRLATYRDAAVAATGAHGAIDAAVTALADFDAANAGRAIADIEADIAAVDPAAEGFDQAQLDALNAELASALTRDADRALLEDAITEAELAAEDAATTEDAALLEAANGRTLSPEAIAHLRDLLNI